MAPARIDCLMGTYGRYTLASEALACFLAQDNTDATMLIYNQHPQPLVFDHPRVRVVNETGIVGSLRYIKERMLELADPAADFIHFWDDDDLYLPWHLDDCLANIGDAAAWKPQRSWSSRHNTEFSLDRHTFEASWLFRGEIVRSASLDGHPHYIDHPIFVEIGNSGRCHTTDLGDDTSYIYRWATGTQHISGYGEGDEATQQGHVQSWRRASRDIRNNGVLVPADLTLRWLQFLDGTRGLVTPEADARHAARLLPGIEL